MLLPLLAYAGSGQRVSAYQTLITGPRRPGEQDGPWWLWGAAWSRPAACRASLAALRALARLAPAGLLSRLPGPARRWAGGRTMVPLRGAGALRSWLRRRGRHD